MYDPASPDSPHIGGAQPTWGNLPFAIELVHAYWQNPDDDPETVEDDLLQNTTQTTLGQVRNFLTKADVVDDDHRLLPNGIWLAEVYEEPDQTTLGDSDTVQIGTKHDLTPAEQAVFKAVLFEKDWLPMLATVNQLATESVSEKETDARAEGFQVRVEHLDKYQSVNKLNSWKKKAQTHYHWVQELDIAMVRDGQIQLTEDGRTLHRQLIRHYHPDWP